MAKKYLILLFYGKKKLWCIKNVWYNILQKKGDRPAAVIAGGRTTAVS